MRNWLSEVESSDVQPTYTKPTESTKHSIIKSISVDCVDSVYTGKTPFELALISVSGLDVNPEDVVELLDELDFAAIKDGAHQEYLPQMRELAIGIDTHKKAMSEIRNKPLELTSTDGSPEFVE